MAPNITQIGNGNQTAINNRKTKITISIGSVVIFVILIAFLLHGNSSFSIEGKWKNTGTDGFGMAQPGAIISFNGAHCNFYSPKDTYSFYKDDSDNHHLDLSSPLGESLSFNVQVVDMDHMEISVGYASIKLKRVE